MYEYKVISHMTHRGLEKELNELAADGWRVVTNWHANVIVLERAKK